MPTEYLPKKKRIKVEASGKSKPPAAGTSDDWWKLHLEKQAKQKIKDDKLANKRKLQEEKKQLAQEKKKLEQKMKEIQEKIKKEKT